MAKKPSDAELVAIWLHPVAREDGHLDLVRGLIRRAATNAADMYSAPGDDQLSADDDALGVKNAIARFAAQCDECQRTARAEEDDSSGAPSQP